MQITEKINLIPVELRKYFFKESKSAFYPHDETIECDISDSISVIFWQNCTYDYPFDISINGATIDKGPDGSKYFEFRVPSAIRLSYYMTKLSNNLEASYNLSYKLGLFDLLGSNVRKYE